MEKTLRQLRRSVLGPSESEANAPSSSNPLISVLLGFTQPVLSSGSDIKVPLVFLDPNLNQSQKEAVQFVLHETEEVGLIRAVFCFIVSAMVLQFR